MRRALPLLALALAACSRGDAAYKNCLRLRVGMTRDELFAIMGPPEATNPYVEGRSLPHLKNRTAYEWENPARFPGPNHVSVSELTGKVESVRCSEAAITAEVYVEPPAKAAAPSAPAPGFPDGLPAELGPDPAEALLKALAPLRPQGAAEGDASAELAAFLSDPRGEAGWRALESAVLKSRLALFGAAWTPETPEELKTRLEQLAAGTRLAQERWTKQFEAESVAGRHDAAEEAARRMAALGALLVQDWSPASRSAGRNLLALGLNAIAKSRGFAGKGERDPAREAARRLLPHALALPPRSVEGAEIERLAASSPRDLWSLTALLARPGGRRVYLDAVLLAAAVRWSPGEGRAGTPWPERRALLALAEADPDPRSARLARSASALFTALEKDVAARTPDLQERWRLPDRF